MRVILCVVALALAACEGPRGPAGAAGRDGAGLAQIVRCSGSLRMSADFTVFGRYNVYDFADGSVMATCDLHDGSGQVFGMQMWAADTTGANEARCLVVADASGASSGGFWQFALSVDNVVGRAQYFDLGSLDDGRVLTMGCQTVPME